MLWGRKHLSLRCVSELSLRHFSSGPAVGGGENTGSFGSSITSSSVYVLLSYLFPTIIFSFLGTWGQPGFATRPSLALIFHICQRGLEGLHSLFLFSYFEEGKDTKSPS